MGRVNSSTSNKIEQGIGNTDDQILSYASISEANGKAHRLLRFNEKELHRMHMDNHGFQI
jgi:hypothetical protein